MREELSFTQITIHLVIITCFQGSSYGDVTFCITCCSVWRHVANLDERTMQSHNISIKRLEFMSLLISLPSFYFNIYCWVSSRSSQTYFVSFNSENRNSLVSCWLSWWWRFCSQYTRYFRYDLLTRLWHTRLCLSVYST